MKTPVFSELILPFLFSSIMLVVGLYLLARFYRLFKRQIRNEFIRQNVVVWMIAICLILACSPTTGEFYVAYVNHKILLYYAFACLASTIESLFVFNISWLILRYLNKKKVSFRNRMVTMLCTIIACAMIVSVPINYLGNRTEGNAPFKNVEISMLFYFYLGCMTGFIYVTMSYVDLDRKRKLSEKELEVARLQQLKTKAELDALHSKINPHFLYNALNSIADLSITDGTKARKMTIALADLFRYSINYSNHNFSTIKEELEMTEVYLAIEKIRFEDKLNYSISSANEVNHYLVPRFMLQPIVENAVKHGLKATGKMTEISVDVRNGDGTLQIVVGDNGPAFPNELIPGYGVKSIYDKLDLLFPNNYEVHFVSQPKKAVTIYIHKLIKNEPTV
jgi:two-component system, LytTR family, sensor kinase